MLRQGLGEVGPRGPRGRDALILRLLLLLHLSSYPSIIIIVTAPILQRPSSRRRVDGLAACPPPPPRLLQHVGRGQRLRHLPAVLLEAPRRPHRVRYFVDRQPTGLLPLLHWCRCWPDDGRGILSHHVCQWYCPPGHWAVHDVLLFPVLADHPLSGYLHRYCNGLTFVPVLAILSQYFNKYRAIAVGLAAAGAVIGGLVYPAMLNFLARNEKVGFPVISLCGTLTLGIVGFSHQHLVPCCVVNNRAVQAPLSTPWPD